MRRLCARSYSGAGQSSLYPFERFSESAKEVLTLAQSEAERGGLTYIGTEHLLLGLIAEADGLGGQVLRGSGLDLAATRAEIGPALSGSGRPVQKEMTTTSPVKRIIETAFDDARLQRQMIVSARSLRVAMRLERH